MKLSVVDLSTVLPGETRSDAFRHSIEIAQHVERLGYERIWFAEHHGARFVAGRAPEVLIAAVGAHTSRIRLGSGSVLLNHYSPYKVGEVFCTLNELYPGRIDLGAGRATTGPLTDYALQHDRSRVFHPDSDEQLSELVAWLDDGFPAEHPFSKAAPIPTIDGLPRLFVLGSSGWSAAAAGRRGLRYVFAGFINQEGAPSILELYRRRFKPYDGPSGIQEPSLILAVHVVCQDDEDEARRHLAPVHVMYRNLARGQINRPNLTPDEAVAELGGPPELERYVPGSGVPPKFIGGTPDRVAEQLLQLAHDLGADEIMIQDMIVDHKARLRSYELLAEALLH